MEYLIIFVPPGAAIMVLAFWKKPNLLSTTLIIPVILGIIGAWLRPSPCAVSTPAEKAVFGALGAYFVAVLLTSTVFITTGAYQWMKYSKDASKRREATQRIVMGGITTIILSVVVFIMVNVVITALGLGALTCLNIPKLK